jgi:hypothetical protein
MWPSLLSLSRPPPAPARTVLDPEFIAAKPLRPIGELDRLTSPFILAVYGPHSVGTVKSDSDQHGGTHRL